MLAVVTSAAAAGAGSLAAALATGDPTITFDVVAMGGNTITLTGSPLQVAHSVEIDGGAGVIVDGADASHILNIDDGILAAGGSSPSADVILRNMTFTNGNNTGGSGGAIFTAENLLLDSVALTDNLANIGGGLSVGANFQTGSVSIENSSLTGNVSIASASAVNFNNGMNLRIVDSVVDGNNGGSFFTNTHTGAVTVNSFPSSNTAVFISGSTISNNVQRGLSESGQNNTALLGGGLFLRATNVTISDSIISGNANLVFSGSYATPESNRRNLSRGGGVFLDAENALIEDSEISGNYAGRGSGLFFYGGGNSTYNRVELNRVTIASNGDGTPFAADLNSDGTIDAGGGIGRDGGGMLAQNSGRVTISDSIVRDNTSNEGGGVAAISSTRLSIERSTVDGNSATFGGGVSLESAGTFRIYNSTVSNNTASRGGGGMNANRALLVMENSTISGNSVFEPGSVTNGYYYSDATVYSDGGGGLRLDGGAAVFMYSSTVTDNSVDFADDNPSTSTFEFNRAGGGVLLTSSTTFSNNVIFQESFESTPGGSYSLNTAFDDGGFDYFGRYNVPDISNNARDEFLIGWDGNFGIHSQDNDGDGGPATVTVDVDGIDISGVDKLSATVSLGALAAEANGFDNYEASNGDGIQIFATIDAGAPMLVAEFAPPAIGPNLGTAAGDLYLDTNGDGIGDGTRLTTVLSDFTFPIPGFGNSLDISIALTSTGSFEPLVVDNLRINELVAETGTANRVILSESIIAGNTITGTQGNFLDMQGADIADVDGAILMFSSSGTASTYSIVGKSEGTTLQSSNLDAMGNRIGTSNSPLDPMLGVLSDNGGTTLTHLPLTGSPAIDSGSPGSTIVVDQTGAVRPSDGDMDGVATNDIGAVEVPGPSSGVDGDFDDDGDYDCDDINSLQNEAVLGSNDPSFDLNNDGLVDIADRDAWLVEAGAANLISGSAYVPGDANLSGSVDVSDFNIWNGFKFTVSSNWCDGDFNMDGSVDVSDFNAWNDAKFTNQGPAPITDGTRHDGKVDLDSSRARFSNRTARVVIEFGGFAEQNVESSFAQHELAGTRTRESTRVTDNVFRRLSTENAKSDGDAPAIVDLDWLLCSGGGTD